MGGIGFQLRSVSRSDGLMAPALSLSLGALVAAGPWIFTVMALALVHQTTAHILPTDQSYDFRGLVIYAFCLSLLATVPIVNVVMREVADDLFLGDLRPVRARYAAALVLCAAASAALSTLVLIGLFDLEARDLAVAVFATTVTGLIWPTLAFCTATRDFSGITFGFLLGLLASVLATILAAHAGLGPQAMMAAFTLGLGGTFIGLAGRILSTFPRSQPDPALPPGQLWRAFLRYRVLAIGSAIAIIALWIDKWIMWLGPDQIPLQNGLVSAPAYDGAMFVAYLTIIPALGLFITTTETSFLDAYRAYYAAIRQRGPLARIRKARSRLEEHSMQMLGRALLMQVIVCALVAAAAPLLVSAVGLQFKQIGTLRLGVIAALFQFQFLACTSLLLFFEQHGRFLMLQLLFLACQAAFTIAAIRLGPEYSGYGHLVACAVAGYAAFHTLHSTLERLDYLTFSAALRQSLDGPPARSGMPRPEPAQRPAAIVWQPAPPSARPKPLLAP